MNGRRIDINELPWAANICQQRLKEVWKSGGAASVAYVEMGAGNVSLFHRHNTFAEIYYILSGGGRLSLDGQEIEVKAGVLVEIPCRTVYNLRNTGEGILSHLVISIPAFNPQDVEVIDD